MSFLYLLEGLRTPFWDAFFGAITNLGDETVFMVAAIVLYWCVSKKLGYYVLCVGMLGTMLNQFEKILCRVPRPWVADPEFTIVESARAKATGYSFPSGHAANITATLGCCTRIAKKWWLRIVFLAVIALVCFSRMYLGVHYPSDVIFSIVVSAALVIIAYPIFSVCDERPEGLCITVVVLVVLAYAFLLFVTLHPFPAVTDTENLANAQKNAWLLAGGGMAMLVGLIIEHSRINFDVRAPWWAQLLKVVLGLAILLGLRMGLKPLLAAVLGTAPVANGIRYFVMVLFGVCIWPMTFPWFAAGCKRAK